MAEVDNVRQFMETPELRWIDSNTARESTGYRRYGRTAAPCSASPSAWAAPGRLAVAALPLLRC